MKRLLILILITLLLSGCSRSTEETIEINGAFEVEKQDQTTQIINSYLSKEISSINLTSNLTLGQRTFTIESNIAPVIGDYICLKDVDGNSFTQDEIESVTSLGGNLYEITIHSGTDFAYSIYDGCSLRTVNMAVNGAITEQVFSVSSLSLNESVEWDITRLICVATGEGVGVQLDKPDDGDFFTTASNNDGIFIRARNGIFYKNIFHAKTNAEIKNNLYDLSYTDKSKQGLYSVTFRITFNGDDKMGAVFRLSANESDNEYHYIDFIVQRDLTDLNTLYCKLQGHETDKYIDLKND